MTYFLDTNVISEIRKIRTPKINANVEAWWSKEKLVHFYISVITLFELEKGVLRMERRDPVQGSVLRTWLERFVIRSFEGQTLPVAPVIARTCATLVVPDKRQLTDALIAATARVHKLKIVTRNIAHFDGTGVDVFNPWRGEI